MIAKENLYEFIDLNDSKTTSLSLPRIFDELVEMPKEVEEIIYGEDGERYISEVNFSFHFSLSKMLAFLKDALFCKFFCKCL